MSAGAQLSVTDQRRMARHPVDHPVIAEHFGKGDLRLHIANISANGFMVDNADGLSRGERVIIRLPVIGRIESYVSWTGAGASPPGAPVSRRFPVRADHPDGRFPRPDRRASAESAPAQATLTAKI